MQTEPTVTPPSRRYLAASFWLLVTAATLGSAAFLGRLAPHYVADSASYVDYPWSSLQAAFQSTRTPGYPLLLRATLAVTGSFAVIPTLQWCLLIATAIALAHELAAWGMPTAARRAAAVVTVWSCTAWQHAFEVATDAPAAACGILCAVALMHWSRQSQRVSSWIAVVLVTTCAISLRPAYLSVLPWLGFAGLILLRQQSIPLKPALMRSTLLCLVALVPLLLWCTARWATVGEFGLVPFGGQNLAGVVVQLVNDDELVALPNVPPAFTESIVEHRQKLSRSDLWYRGDDRAYITWEERWHDVTWRVVVPASIEVAGTNNLATHRLVQRLNGAILKAYPQRYAIYLAKALRRSVWVGAADIAMHPPFLFVLGVLVLTVLYVAFRGRVIASIAFPPGFTALLVVGLSYAVMQTTFICLSTPPIGRFTDAAWIFVPAIFAAVIAHVASGFLAPTSATPIDRRHASQ